MNILLNQYNNELNKKEKVEDLFVKNIIVNKNNTKKQFLPYIATERWIDQLGKRLQIN